MAGRSFPRLHITDASCWFDSSDGAVKLPLEAGLQARRLGQAAPFLAHCWRRPAGLLASQQTTPVP